MQGSWHDTMRDEVQMARNVKCTSFVVMVPSRAPHATRETQQVKSARASPLAFSSIASQPRSFSYTPKMARNANCAFCVVMALGHARQATGEILIGKFKIGHKWRGYNTLGPIALAIGRGWVEGGRGFLSFFLSFQSSFHLLLAHVTDNHLD